MTDAKLKSYVERIDRVMTAMDTGRADIAQIVKDAKGDGYIPKTLRKVATRYHGNPDKVAAEDALLETYEAALGRVGKALADVRAGSTWKAAGEKHGVKRATLARAAAVSKRLEVIPHDAETGEVCGDLNPVIQPIPKEAPEGSYQLATPQPADPTTPTGGNHGEGEECLSGRDERSDEHSTATVREDWCPSGFEYEPTLCRLAGTCALCIDIKESCGGVDAERSALHPKRHVANGFAPNVMPAATGPQDALPIDEIHRGAMQPKGCAKVMWTEPSMSGSVVASGDAVRDASAMPLDVVAAPHSEGREHADSAATAPPACIPAAGVPAAPAVSDGGLESCGIAEGREADRASGVVPYGAPTPAGVESGPQDTLPCRGEEVARVASPAPRDKDLFRRITGAFAPLVAHDPKPMPQEVGAVYPRGKATTEIDPWEAIDIARGLLEASKRAKGITA